jgi:DNA-binding CsgD family transcriptional regulator/PAS domain-containing protein
MLLRIVRRGGQLRQSGAMRPRKAVVEIAPSTEAAARILDRAPGAGLLLLDARGRVVHAGAGGGTVAGRSRDELLGKPFVDLIDPVDREAALRILSGAGDATSPPARAVLRLAPPQGGQGRRAVVACWKTPVDGGEAPLLCVLRRTADGERPDGRLDRPYVLELVHGSRVVSQFSAWGIEQHLGGSPPDGLAPADAWDSCVAFSDRGVYGEAWTRSAAGQPVTCTYRLTGFDGETRWMLDRSWPVTIAGGRQLLYGIVTDVTDHVAPRLTGADDAQVAAAMRAVGDLAFTVEALPGRRAEWTFTSRSPDQFYGVQPEPGESMAEAFLAAVEIGDRPAWEAHIDAVARGLASDVVVSMRRRDGVVRRMWFRSVPASAPDGGTRGIGVSTDVTDILAAAPAGRNGPPAEAPEINDPAGSPALTPRQREILRLLADGRSNEEIAQALDLSRTTVRNHTSGLYARLGVRSRLEAVAVARRRGIVT